MASILPLETGTLVGGHYRIEGLINTGGFGSVYRGVAFSEGNRLCAIKETYDVTPAARRQALMEAAVLFTIKSIHLPQVYDAFEENGRFYLVMQLIEGQNCAQLVKTHGGPFSEQEVLNWLLPVADVLQELHGRNPPVLHRDIKPANIILTPQGQAVLVDFGLTRLYDPSTQTQTIARAVSEGFSPLEQYIGQTSPQSDIYALAATMYFLLTAQVPPAAVARSLRDTLPPPHQTNPRISPGTERALLRALAVNVEQRQVSMQEFARELRGPAFGGYNDQTISQTRYQAASAPTIQESISQAPPPPPPPPDASWSQPRPLQIYQPIPVNVRQISEPVPGWPPPPGGAVQQPIGRSGQSIPPPAGGSLDTSPIQYRPLPGPFQQGCLWGLLQAVFSAALLLIFKHDIFFYLGLAEGLLFYLLAGFFTTRRGGAVTRALRAGLWAGITSTVMYWIVLPLGLLIEALPRIQRIVDQARVSGNPLPAGEALQRAINQVKPPILTNNPLAGTNQSQGWSPVLILLAIGLACALGFALLGGLLGLKNEGHRQSNSRPRIN